LIIFGKSLGIHICKIIRVWKWLNLLEQLLLFFIWMQVWTLVPYSSVNQSELFIWQLGIILNCSFCLLIHCILLNCFFGWYEIVWLVDGGLWSACVNWWNLEYLLQPAERIWISTVCLGMMDDASLSFCYQIYILPIIFIKNCYLLRIATINICPQKTFMYCYD
jgi:hypothetical protein